MIGFFADNEESDSVIGFNVVKIIDIGSDEFEDEHNIIPSVKIYFFILFKSNSAFLLFFSLLK